MQNRIELEDLTEEQQEIVKNYIKNHLIEELDGIDIKPDKKGISDVLNWLKYKIWNPNDRRPFFNLLIERMPPHIQQFYAPTDTNLFKLYALCAIELNTAARRAALLQPYFFTLCTLEELDDWCKNNIVTVLSSNKKTQASVLSTEIEIDLDRFAIPHQLGIKLLDEHRRILALHFSKIDRMIIKTSYHTKQDLSYPWAEKDLEVLTAFLKEINIVIPKLELRGFFIEKLCNVDWDRFCQQIKMMPPIRNLITSEWFQPYSESEAWQKNRFYQAQSISTSRHSLKERCLHFFKRNQHDPKRLNNELNQQITEVRRDKISITKSSI